MVGEQKIDKNITTNIFTAVRGSSWEQTWIHSTSRYCQAIHKCSDEFWTIDNGLITKIGKNITTNFIAVGKGLS